MPIDDHEKETFDAAPVRTKLSMLYVQQEKIYERLGQHPTNCESRFFAMEKDIKRLSKWKMVESAIAISSAIGVSIGLALAYIKGWAIFLPKE